MEDQPEKIMKKIILILLLTIPAGLMAQTNAQVEALAQKLAQNAKASSESLREATTTYRNSLTKLLEPLSERLKVLTEDRDKKLLLVKEGSLKDTDITYITAEFDLVNQSIKDTLKKLEEADGFQKEIENSTQQDFHETARKMIADQKRQDRLDRQERLRASRTPKVYIVGFFIIEASGTSIRKVKTRR